MTEQMAELLKVSLGLWNLKNDKVRGVVACAFSSLVKHIHSNLKMIWCGFDKDYHFFPCLNVRGQLLNAHKSWTNVLVVEEFVLLRDHLKYSC